MKKHTFFIVLIICVALAIGMWRDNQGLPVSESSANALTLSSLQSGTALPQPMKLPRFELEDVHGKPFTNRVLKKHWSFVFFGYVACPDICPATLNTFQQVSQRLGSGFNTQFVLISINPEQDTPARIREYLEQEKFSHTTFVGVTGDKTKIHALAQTLGIHIEAQTDDPAAKEVNHGGAILLINPDGKLMAVFTPNAKAQAIVQDFKEILHRHARSV